MSKVVERRGNVERWEFHGGQDGRIYGGGDLVFSLEEDGRDALALCADYIDEDGLRELFHPSVVRAVQRRLGIPQAGVWVVKVSVMGSTMYLAPPDADRTWHLAYGQRFAHKHLTRKAASLAAKRWRDMFKDETRVVRLVPRRKQR